MTAEPQPQPQPQPQPVLIVTGPTAAGKSRLALDAAGEFSGTLINGDSMQLYTELPILTARPTAAEERRVPHRLFGVLRAAEACSVGAWLEMAWEEIARAWEQGRLPIVVGGSGLYLKALRDGLSPIPPIPAAIRRAARALHAELGGAAFHARLAARDAVGAARLAVGDSQRLVRAWEVIEATGRPLNEWHAPPPPLAPSMAARFGMIVLDPPRAELAASIEVRVAGMMQRGALDEVRALMALGLDPQVPAMKALGVAQLGALARGETDAAAATRALATATRRYAKRQATWNRGQIVKADWISAQYSESLRPKIFSIIRNLLLTTK